MGLRFQKRIKIAPGITVNLSKSGISTSIGPRGAKITTGHGKTRTTLGIPGTGISQTSVVKNSNAPPGLVLQVLSAVIYVCVAIGFLMLWIFT